MLKPAIASTIRSRIASWIRPADRRRPLVEDLRVGLARARLACRSRARRVRRPGPATTRAAGRRPYDTAAPCPIAPSLPPRLTAPSPRCALSPSGSSPFAPACASSSGRRASSCTAIGGNGGGYAASDLNAAQAELTGLAEAAVACVERLAELGRAGQGSRPRPARLPVGARTAKRCCSAGTSGEDSVDDVARPRRGLRGPETDRLGRIGPDVRVLAARR